MKKQVLHILWCIVLQVLLLLPLPMVAATDEHQPPTRISAWTEDESFALRDAATVDSTYLNHCLHNTLDDYSIMNIWNGNMISPALSAIYTDRKEKSDFLFARAYSPFILYASDVRFYDTTTPYSWISYNKGFKTYREENSIDFGFTANLNRRTNLGLTLNYQTTVGRYESQSGKRFQGCIFGRYDGNNYGLEASLILNNLSNFENGGIQDAAEYMYSTIAPEDYPTRMEGMSGFRHISGWLNHHYSITVERERQVTEDSIAIDYIPVTTFQHTFAVTQECKKYIEKSRQSQFYEHTYFNTRSSSDTANVLNIRNTALVRFEEEFNKVLKFGADVYALNECQRYAFATREQQSLFGDNPIGNPNFNPNQPQIVLPTDTTMGYQWTNNTFVGGRIYKQRGKYFFFNAQGDVCLLGYKLGEFKVLGDVMVEVPLSKSSRSSKSSSELKLTDSGTMEHRNSGTLHIKANAFLKNEQPSYFLQHYLSNHFCWENDFGKVYKFRVGGEVSYPSKYVDVQARVDFENLTHYIYFAENGLPVQDDGNIQVLAAAANVNIHTKHFGMENTLVYQHSSSAVLPLPDFTLYTNLYYYGCWFKALDTQWGVDLRYNTRYYAPILNPATGQFCVQQKAKVGNYPMMNVYANFYVKHIRLRLFVEYTHLSALFMAKHKDYFSMPDYPQNPAMFKAGLAWHFYR